MVIHHLLTGMILQVRGFLKTAMAPPSHNDQLGELTKQIWHTVDGSEIRQNKTTTWDGAKTL